MHIVLGGTSGLGHALVEQLRDANKEVLVLGSSYDAKKHGNGMRLDLASRESVEGVVEQLKVELQARIVESFWWVAGYGYTGDFAL